LHNWTVEQHVPDGYEDFVVRDKQLVMLDAGNRILPNIPKLHTFLLKGSVDANWHINDRKFSLQIYFAYDEYTRHGPMLEFGVDGNKIFARVLSAGQQVLCEKDITHIDGIIADFEVELQDNTISLNLNGTHCIKHTLSHNCSGSIALSRGSFLGELRVSAFDIRSTESLKEEIVYTDLQIPFAAINGMDIPIVWTVNATRTGNITQVDIELSGGERSRPDIPWFPYHGHYVEFLQQPYLRIESAHQVIELTISNETLVLAIPKTESFYIVAHKKPTWPFKRSFLIRDLEPKAVLFAGYRAYGNRAVNKHLEVKDPYETAYDVESARIIYSGQAIGPGSVAIELHSSEDKRICKQIPDSTHEYAKALTFAQKNHYFYNTEECSFNFTLFSRVGQARKQLRIDYRLEDAFFEPLGEYTTIPLTDSVKVIALDIEQLQSDAVELGRLSAGVYHLRFKLYDGATLLHSNWRAFEVSSATQSGLEASRLPKCFSMSNEVKAQDTDYFDPWSGDCVDVSHYTSIVSAMMPHFAREKRLWELLEVYKREWFLFHDGRVLEDCNIEHNHELIRHCDYIFFSNGKKNVFFKLAARQYFHKHVTAILYEYALENDFRRQHIKKCLDTGTIPDKDTFDALVENHYYQFIDFFWGKYVRLLQNIKQQIALINPNAKYTAYGPFALYASSYKTAHAMTYAGNYKDCRDMQNICDGFYFFEDYPHTCRYSINRGPFATASVKLLSPNVRIYPEMYVCPETSVPCPDSAVARVWPSYGMWSGRTKNESSMKRVLEYVYACVWYDGDKFNYWRDYGFQTRLWERERFAELLKLWGFVDKHQGKHPLKANAFVCSEECCRNHRVYYDEYCGNAWGDLFNTAEESTAYSYEMSRNAGQNTGFVTDLDCLATIDASSIDTLVIPPLTKVSEAQLRNVRRLHERGVSLLAFEEVGGLEDVFGVVESQETRVSNIRVNVALADNPLMELAEGTEYSEHRACKGKYQAREAEVLLEGEVPVLFTNQSKWGKTALFNVPPTAVRRQDQCDRVSMGRDCVSKLINESTKLVFRYLSNPAVETSDGKIIAFEDTKGVTHIIVEEDAHPMPAVAIRPIIMLNIPNVSGKQITSEHDFTIISQDKNRIQLRLNLEPDEYAIMSFK